MLFFNHVNHHQSNRRSEYKTQELIIIYSPVSTIIINQPFTRSAIILKVKKYIFRKIMLFESQIIREVEGRGVRGVGDFEFVVTM